VAKYGTMRKRRTDYSWLNMRSLRKSSERVETIWGRYQKQRLESTMEILSIGKERV